jgi:HEAT repeat protein
VSDYEDMLKGFDDIIADESESLRRKPSLDEALKFLKGKQTPHLRREILDGLSDLSTDEVQQFDVTWQSLDAAYRRRVVRSLIAFGEANFEADYGAVGILAMGDPDPAVRESAIELLWEDQSLEVLNLLIQIATTDQVAEARAAAATGLSRFIHLGEMEDIPHEDAKVAQDCVIGLLQNPLEPVVVQRRALEAIANSSHPLVPGAIEDAYRSGNHLMQVSAVFAMGRTFDKRWHEIVLTELESEDPELQFEAVRAAGELRLRDSVPGLGKVIAQGEREIMEMAAWSLGEIGGKEAIRILEALAEVAEEGDDEELLEVIDDAIASTALADMIVDEDDLENLYGLDV